MASIGLPLAFFSLILVVVLIVCLLVVKYFEDRHAFSALARWVVVATLVTLQLAVFVVPVDIYNVSHHLQFDDLIRGLYFAFFLATLVLAFVVIPFTFFFVGPTDGTELFAGHVEDADIVVAEPPVSTLRRLWVALKCTTAFLVLAVVIVSIGLSLRFGRSANASKDMDWVKYVLDTDHDGDASIGFIVACMVLIGIVFFVTYAAYGLAALPIRLFERKHNDDHENWFAEDSSESIRDEIRLIRSKYALTRKKASREDRILLARLRFKERQLNDHNPSNKFLSAYRGLTRESCIGRIMRWLYPIRFLIGVVFSVASLSLFVGLLLTSIDRIRSSCGFSCGFALDHPSPLWNPIDRGLTWASQYFPLDFIMLCVLLGVFFFSTIYGVVGLGVRVFFFRLYPLRRRGTPPRGLLVASALMLLILITFMVQLFAFFPQYLTFGDQKYLDPEGARHTCTLQTFNTTAISSGFETAAAADPHYDGFTVADPGPAKNGTACEMTQLAFLVSSIQTRIPFFGTVFYFADWFMIVSIVFSFAFVIWKKCNSKNYSDLVTDRYEGVGLLTDFDRL